jgi:hypothetical protein
MKAEIENFQSGLPECLVSVKITILGVMLMADDATTSALQGSCRHDSTDSYE